MLTLADAEAKHESIKREMRGRVLNEHFDFNPKNLNVITDKPTNKEKIDVSVPQDEKPDATSKALTKKLGVLTNVPKKKYPYPMTS